MRRAVIYGCFVISILALSTAGMAADYYASSIHPNRSDSHSGTSPDAPWATFGKVKSEWNDLEAGDTVHLERGSQWNLSFNGDYWYVSSGGDGSGQVILRGDDYGSGDKPILKRTGGSGDSAFFVIQTSYITFRDFELDGGHSDYGKNTLGLSIGDDNDDVSHVNILNLRIHNLGGNSSKYICGIWVVSPGYTVSDCLIEGNEVSDYSAHGLNHYSPAPMINITWRNNIVRNSFTGGRYPDANSALQITSGGRGCVFEFNYLEDTTTTEGGILGFGKYADDTGTNTIRYNVIPDSNTYGILFTIDHTNRKLLYDMYGNVIYDARKSGLAIHPYNSYANGTRFRIFNNTFVDNCRDGGDSYRGSVEFDQYCDNTYIELFNNLIVQPNEDSTVGLAVDNGFSGTLNHHNNFYWHESGASRNVVRHGSLYSPSGITDYEDSAKGVDPQFVDAQARPISVNTAEGALPVGLTPASNSPAADGAMHIASFSQSINLVERMPNWSYGAFQYEALRNPLPPTGLRIVP